LARAPLGGAFKLAVEGGVVAVSPLAHAPQPKARRAIPRHWTPEQAREFLVLMEGDRTYPLWAFLMGSGLRIGELVWLRWRNVDLDAGVARVVEFATYVGYEVVASDGKSRDAVRTIGLDRGLVGVLRPSASSRPPSGSPPLPTGRATACSPSCGARVEAGRPPGPAHA
jgi:integrase